MTSKKSAVIGGAGQSEGEMARGEIVAMFERRQDAYNRLDAAALAADYAENCIVESPIGGTLKGRQAVEDVARALFSAFADFKVQTERLVIDGQHVAQVLTRQGTDIGGYMGLPASGKSFRVPAVFLFELKDRQIVRERRIYDFTGVLMQIGVLKAKPV